MTFRPDEWARVKELFEGALALAPSQRSSFIASACGDDDALRRQVEELLASHEQAKSFLETPAVLGDLVARNLEGHQLGPYHLESRIGAGGMGEVYRGRDTRLNHPGRDQGPAATCRQRSQRARTLRARRRA